MPVATGSTLTLTLVPVPESARRARRVIVNRGLDPDLEHTVSLLTTELLANAIKHAPSTAEVRLAAALAPGYARVEVLDEGPGFDPDAVTSGLGLRLVDKLASSWGVERGDRGTLVWFEVDRRRRRFTR